MVTSGLLNHQRAKLTHILHPKVEPEAFLISDHKMLIMSIKANCSIQTNMYIEKDVYKLSRLINSHRVQRTFKESTAELAIQLKHAKSKGANLNTINDILTSGLIHISDTVIKKVSTKKKLDTRTNSEPAHLKSARKALSKAKA